MTHGQPHGAAAKASGDDAEEESADSGPPQAVWAGASSGQDVGGWQGSDEEEAGHSQPTVRSSRARLGPVWETGTGASPVL